MRTIAMTALLLAMVAAAKPAAQAPAATATQDIVKQVRQAIADQDFGRGEKLIADDRALRGVTPENLAAQSWLGRGALAEKRLDAAERYAEATYKEAAAMAAKRPLDANPNAPLPIALGAAVEVLAQASAQRGARTEAVTLVRSAIATHRGTSVEMRLQKNLNLLSLEGTPAPALDLSEYIGPKPPALADLKGKVVLQFFWAHWCPDCKVMGPILADLQSRYGAQGLVVMAPTQRYGYVAGGKEAPPDEERRYIEQVRQTNYASLASQPIPLASANHLRYGVSTTPTVVLVDREGLVRLYNPGKMTLEALEPLVKRLVGSRTN
jgi:thiol-disulfide isomerase/thioredoxin